MRPGPWSTFERAAYDTCEPDVAALLTHPGRDPVRTRRPGRGSRRLAQLVRHSPPERPHDCLPASAGPAQRRLDAVSRVLRGRVPAASIWATIPLFTGLLLAAALVHRGYAPRDRWPRLFALFAGGGAVVAVRGHRRRLRRGHRPGRGAALVVEGAGAHAPRPSATTCAGRSASCCPPRRCSRSATRGLPASVPGARGPTSYNLTSPGTWRRPPPASSSRASNASSNATASQPPPGKRQRQKTGRTSAENADRERRRATAPGRDPDEERQQHAAEATSHPSAAAAWQARRQPPPPRASPSRPSSACDTVRAGVKPTSRSTSRSAPLNAGRLASMKSGIHSVAPKATPSPARRRTLPPSAPPATTPPATEASTRTAAGRSIVPPR